MTRIMIEIEDELSKGRNRPDTGNYLKLAQKILSLCFMDNDTMAKVIIHSYQGYELTLDDIVICNIGHSDIYSFRYNYRRSVTATVFIRKNGKRVNQIDAIITPCIVQIRLKSLFNRDADVYEFECLGSSRIGKPSVTLIQSPK